MKQAFCLFIAVVFLFKAADVQGQATATLDNIDCSDASMITFTIDIPDFDEWEGSTDERSWSLNGIDNEACEPKFNEVTGLVTYSNINVDICAPGDPVITSDNSKFEYEFAISVKAGAGSAIDPVTFAYDHDYVVKCFYNREKEDLMASFQPLHSLTDSGSGVSDFIIEFTVHKAADDIEVAGIIDLRTEVYGKIVITGANSLPQGLDVHLREVTADTDNTAGGDEFSLITNGCVDSPSIVSSVVCDDDGDDRFDFQIFRFPGQSEPDKVYLRAKVIVCLSGEMGTTCKTECSACPEDRPGARKRRDTLEELQQTEFYVTAGPFKIRDPDRQDSEAAAGEDKGTEGTPFPAYMIAVVAACGLLAVAIVSAVVLIVFRRRRQNVANVELQNENSVTA